MKEWIIGVLWCISITGFSQTGEKTSRMLRSPNCKQLLTIAQSEENQLITTSAKHRSRPVEQLSIT
jgi:hypothetical protein